MKNVPYKKTREINTYSYIWSISESLFARGVEEKDRSFSQFLASLIFTAFAWEAYLNHLGSKLFTTWDRMERLGPTEKFYVLCEKLSIEPDPGRRPWQTLGQLFKLRNRIAHGKSEILTDEGQLSAGDNLLDRLHEDVKTDWEEYVNQDNAERAHSDIYDIVKMMHEAANLKDDFPFQYGGQTGKA